MSGDNEYIIKERLSDIVIDRIASKIHSGEWKPGSKLPSERKLAETLGVSRTVLREALADKAITRLIEVRDGHKYVRSFSIGELVAYMAGHFVLDKKSIFEIMEIRSVLEEYSARKAATCITPEKVNVLQNNINEMAALISKGEDAFSLDTQFHRGIAEAANNEVLLSVYTMLENLLKSTFNITWRAADAIGVENTAIPDHQAILDAICSHDSHEAERRMSMHLSIARDRLKKIDLS